MSSEPEPKSLLFLKDVMHSCVRVGEYVAGLSIDTLVADKDRFEAVRRHLVIIGEGSCQLPRQVRDFYPAVEWGMVIRLRYVGPHGLYSPGVNRDTVWYAVTVTVPRLLAALCDEERPKEALIA